jgi:RHS repeat-associated protein
MQLASLVVLSLLAAVAQAQTVEYIHTDALGSPVAITNASGTVIERTVYEPYGAVVNHALSNGPGFTGHVTDAATSLTYMQQRYFDPTVGRFLSVDPVTADSSVGDNFNRYWYADNNPYRFTDPNGTCTGSHIESADGTCKSTGGFNTGTTGIAQGNMARAATKPSEESGPMGAALAAGGVAAVADGPAPIGDAIAVVVIGGTAIYVVWDKLADKMAAEIEGVMARAVGPQGEQYSLRASRTGPYPDVRGGVRMLNAGDVWKYGQSINGSGRYSRAYLTSMGLTYTTEFRGSQMQTLIQEKFKLYGYYTEHGRLPPGNSIFR